MMIDGNLGPVRPHGRSETTRATDKTGPARTEPDKGSDAAAGPLSLDENPVHDTEALRAAASHLLEEGDLGSTQDGEIRHNRVEQIRRKYEAGEYDRREIIAEVVNRLIDEWNI
jgi:anti-sigma28 factor (negative regulator of flagellin synthesis)